MRCRFIETPPPSPHLPSPHLRPIVMLDIKLGSHAEPHQAHKNHNTGLPVPTIQGYLCPKYRATCTHNTGLPVPTIQGYLYPQYRATCTHNTGLPVPNNTGLPVPTIQGYLYPQYRATYTRNIGLLVPTIQCYLYAVPERLLVPRCIKLNYQSHWILNS